MSNPRNHRTMKLAFSPPSGEAPLVCLFSVTVTHSYYTDNRGLCPDFAITPTPASAKLMSQLGMAMRAEAAGFSVFIQRGRVDELFAYLASNAQVGPAGPAYWERLSFTLRLTQRVFIDITDLPLDTRTAQSKLFACNLDAHQDGALAVLSAGAHMDGAALRPVVGTEVSLVLPPEAAGACVTGLSGAIAVPLPDVLPMQGLVTLDLSDLPYDQYTVVLVDAHRQPVQSGKYPWTVLYSEPQADAMVLLDLLFTQPTSDSGGVYPVSTLFGAAAPTCVKVAYQLPFAARPTFWQYYVVSQDPAGVLRDLAIEGPGARFAQAAQPVILPNGTAATVFQSDQALPLRQKSEQRFHLKGRRRDANGHENAIWIARLPVAASAPVWPSPDQRFSSGISEIFVYV